VVPGGGGPAQAGQAPPARGGPCVGARSTPCTPAAQGRRAAAGDSEQHGCRVPIYYLARVGGVRAPLHAGVCAPLHGGRCSCGRRRLVRRLGAALHARSGSALPGRVTAVTEIRAPRCFTCKKSTGTLVRLKGPGRELTCPPQPVACRARTRCSSATMPKNMSCMWMSLCTSPSMSPDAAATPAGATGPAVRSQPAAPGSTGPAAPGSTWQHLAAPGSTGPAAWSLPAAPGVRPLAGLCAPPACRQPARHNVCVPGLPLACGVAPGRNGLRAWPRTVRADPGTS